MPPLWKDDTAAQEQQAQRRARMVQEQLRLRGIHDERLLSAMGQVPREKFIEPQFQAEAYADGPLPIGVGQTISQPLMVATMIEALQVLASDRVLEVGAGTGYQAAILGELASEVWTVERHGELADEARRVLLELGYRNVHVLQGDGSCGLPDQAPFDKILIAAGAPQVPPSLIAQLVNGGAMAVPVGGRVEQELHLVRKIGGEVVTTRYGRCCFVPLVGAEGWKP